MKFCLTCGDLSNNSYCEQHFPEVRKAQRGKPKHTAQQRGYDSRWARLSRKARKLQPFCSDCGATEDLQLDHSPETWERIRDRKPIRLEHTGGVVCGNCNRARGDARTPGGRGYSRPEGHPGGVGQIANLLASNIVEGVRNGEGWTEEGR